MAHVTLEQLSDVFSRLAPGARVVASGSAIVNAHDSASVYEGKTGRPLRQSLPVVLIGPIGSRSDYLQAFITDKGVMIRAGCFFDTRDQFEEAIAVTHGMNEHGTEYLAALALIDAHAELWAPKEEVAA